MIDLEYDILSQLVRITASYTERYLEIGSYHGRSLQVVCQANPQMEAHSIDKQHRPRLVKIAKQNPKIKLHRSNSASINWENLGKFDSIFIDGAHGKKMVGIDLRNSWNAWNRTGFFAGDDYNTAPGVFDAVNEFFDITIKEEAPGKEYVRKYSTGHKRVGKTTPEASPEEVLEDACMFKTPKITSRGYFQVFGMLFVCFSEEVYKHCYDEIHQMAYKILSSDTVSPYYLNKIPTDTTLGYRLPYTLPPQADRILPQNQ